ncbi:unnamed protein product [Cylindrotheca closterium]|uniref:DUF6824 domain-containing protein n=1 Tax=Cylindrotheca closterium TaxID=2856 RepID=A0AAD2CFA7_9STRA|nr:unnamed protein product [Cylindrotheca closterium]
MTVNTLHEQLALQEMSHASPLTHTSSLNAQLRLAQFIELEAAILARRALVPSSWLLRQALADRATGSSGDIGMVLKSARHFTPSFSTTTAQKPSTIKPGGAGLSLDVPSELDILCGRGGKSNHHAGNKRYRQVISDMKARYRSIGSKTAKTHVSRAIVEHVHGYGGRFLRFDTEKRKYIVLSAAEARKKTSQALREAKEVKWTK